MKNWQEFDQSINADALPLDDLEQAGWKAHFDECERRFTVICRAAPQCKCGTFQVQIIKTSPPAVWKCRICKTVWEFEPESSSGKDNVAGDVGGAGT